jgi:pheromone shutdown protein TraB
MALLDTAKILAKAGSIVCIVLGILAAVLNGLMIYEEFAGHHGIAVESVLWFSLAIVAIVFGFIVLLYCIPRTDSDQQAAALYFIIFGVIAAIGSYLVGGVLIFVAGILVAVEQAR